MEKFQTIEVILVAEVATQILKLLLENGLYGEVIVPAALRAVALSIELRPKDRAFTMEEVHAAIALAVKSCSEGIVYEGRL